MKIVDAFIFYNELDLLNYRLNILNEVVDYFVIVEATHTYAGKAKPLFFEENRAKFETFLPKIIHIIVRDFQYTYPAIDFSKRQQWDNEYHQRNCISRGIDMIGLSDPDIIIISDVDEIPDPATLIKVKSGDIVVEKNSLQQDLYYYNLMNKFKDYWCLAKVLSYAKYKANPCPEGIRSSIAAPLPYGGWHLSHFGDAAFIQNKLRSFSHQELNTEYIASINNIENAIKSGTVYYDRYSNALQNVRLEDNSYLPPRYKEFLLKASLKEIKPISGMIPSNYKRVCDTRSDINEHLPTLRRYASQCSSVAEMGVRSVVSTWAFLQGLLDTGKPASLQCIDINDVPAIPDISRTVSHYDISMSFVKGDSATTPIEPVDLLFIDTWHVYAHLKRELAFHCKSVNKYIIMHDTTLYGDRGESVKCGWNTAEQAAKSGYPEAEIRMGLEPAVREFLEWHPEWFVKEVFTNNNGLTVLEKRPIRMLA